MGREKRRRKNTTEKSANVRWEKNKINSGRCISVEMEGGSLFCDVESVEEKEGVVVFTKDNDDFCLKKEAVKI